MSIKNLFTTLLFSVSVLTTLNAQFERGSNLAGGGFSTSSYNNNFEQQTANNIGADYFRFISPTWGIGLSASGSFWRRENQFDNLNSSVPQLTLKSSNISGGLGLFVKRVRPVKKTEKLSFAFTLGTYYRQYTFKTDSLNRATATVFNTYQSNDRTFLVNIAPSLMYQLTSSFFLEWRFANAGFYTSRSTNSDKRTKSDKSYSFYASVYPSVLNMTILYHWK